MELEDVGDQLVGAFQNPGILIGIPLALLGAVFMSFGAQYQHRGVTKVESLSGGHSSEGLGLSHLMKLLARPSWVIGTVMLGLAIVCQLSALFFAPLIVVQPLGARTEVIMASGSRRALQAPGEWVLIPAGTRYRLHNRGVDSTNVVAVQIR